MLTRPCPFAAEPGHAHDLALYRVVIGQPTQVLRVAAPPADDAQLYFWAADAADIWAIIEGESQARAGQHMIWAADLDEIAAQRRVLQ